MMKVCFLLGGLQGNGGLGRVTSILANQLSKRNDIEIHTISYLQDERPLCYPLSPAIHTHCLYTQSLSMAKAIFTKHAIKKVRDIIKEENIDLLIACGALYYPLAVLACNGCSTKCISWEHTNPATTNDYKFQGICRKIGIRYSKACVVLTKSAKDYYINQLHVNKKKIFQIYNPIDVHTSPPYNPSSKKIISVGRLSYPKNFSLLLDIAKIVLAKYPDWSWDIYGEGELETELQEKAKALKLTDKVHFMGKVDNLYALYPSYAFLVMTSRYEGFPMSLLEGASSRLPLVSFDVPTGPDEIIDEGKSGFLVSPFDEESMVEKISLLIENEPLRLEFSANAFKSSHRFTLKGIEEQWIQVWCNLIAQ